MRKINDFDMLMSTSEGVSEVFQKVLDGRSSLNALAPFFYGFFILLTALSLGQVTESLLRAPTVEVSYREAGLPHVYGPVPLEEEQKSHYEFYKAYFTRGAFDSSIPLDRVSEVSKEQLKSLMLQAVPRNLRQRLSVFIPYALGYAEKYQVDPFWAVAIMWTESHFNPHAESYVDAQGLMQILPGTGQYLFKLMDRPVGQVDRQLVRDPQLNMEMGVFYLRRLLKRFDGSYKYATVAYNMGPTRIKRRLYRGLPVGVNNLYLDKVTRAYRKLSAAFKSEVLSKPRPFVKTLAAYPHYKDGRDLLFELYSLHGFFHQVPLASHFIPSTPYPAAERSKPAPSKKIAQH